jgi:hypothetical protein
VEITLHALTTLEASHVSVMQDTPADLLDALVRKKLNQLILDRVRIRVRVTIRVRVRVRIGVAVRIKVRFRFRV